LGADKYIDGFDRAIINMCDFVHVYTYKGIILYVLNAL
jgi:hypothetical protein